jgi:hypothetical protein
MNGLIDFAFLCGILIFGIFLNQTSGPCETSDWPDVEIKESIASASTRDVAGVSEQGLGTATDLELAIPFYGVDVDTDYSLQGLLSRKRLVASRDLRAEIDGLGPGVTRDALETSIDLVGVTLEAIENNPDLSIEALEDYTEEVIDVFKDAIIPCLEGAQGELERHTFGSMWVKAQALEKRYKNLEYVMSKVRRYARSPSRSVLTELLRRAILASSEGDEAGYFQSLDRLLACVAEGREISIKGKEADRIRNRADSLLRSLQDRGHEEAIGIDLEVEVAGIFLDGSLSSQWTHAIAPSEEKEIKGFTLRAEWEDEALESALEVATSGVRYSDRLKWDEDENRHRIKLAIERGDTFEMSVSWESERHPCAFDDEIETPRVCEVVAALRSLIVSIKESEIDPDLKDDLVEELAEEGAIGALLEGERGNAVKGIKGFIDTVNDEVWEGKIDSATARRWVKAAERILPREREYRLDVPVEATWPLWGGTLLLALEWEREIHPADSDLTRSDVAREMVYRSTGGDIGLETSFAQIETVYPWAAEKDKVVREWAFKLESVADPAQVEMDYSRETVVYPSQPTKDKSIQELAVSFEVSVQGLTLQVAQEDEASRYPNCLDRPDERKREVSVDLTGTVGRITFEMASTQIEQYRRPVSFEEVLVRKDRILEFRFDFELDKDLAFFSEMQWEEREDREDVTDDEGGFRIELGCTMTL